MRNKKIVIKKRDNINLKPHFSNRLKRREKWERLKLEKEEEKGVKVFYSHKNLPSLENHLFRWIIGCTIGSKKIVTSFFQNKLVVPLAVKKIDTSCS
jgi:hypothetical protein